MIDQFGQFMHKQWPGKTHSTDELKRDTQNELEDLAAHPGPSDWNQYGGWKDGPQLKATGFFYPLKHGGKWWLVDPAGRLFWSHGVDCVGFSNGVTPISDREFYYAELPTTNSSTGEVLRQRLVGPARILSRQRKPTAPFNFTGANLRRKYGDDWYNKAADFTQERLRSWSLNTIANWSDSGIYRQAEDAVCRGGRQRRSQAD